MNGVTELYSAAELAALERKNRIRRGGLLGFIAAALLACLVLCAMTDTANAARMERRVIVLSALGGWAAIFYGVNVCGAGRREAQHVRLMLDGERSVCHGAVTVTAERAQIPGSVSVYTVLCREGEKTRRLHLDVSRAGALRAAPSPLTLYTVHNYIVAFEETHEAP